MEKYIFGIHPLIEYIESGKTPEKVLIQRGLQGSNFQRLFSLIRNKKIPFQMVPLERLNKTGKKNHQGILAYIPAIDYARLEDIIPGLYESGERPLILIMEGITDVRNLGAAARTAECAGAHAIVIPEKGGASVSADAVKASAGALSRIPVCREGSLLQSLAFLRECGLKILSCDSRGKRTLYDEDLREPLAVVIGSEDRGISPAIRKVSDDICSIPMKGKIDSLNVSVATGVVLFEVLRQRRVD